MSQLKLTWNDLLIQDADPEELAESLEPWSFLIRGEVAPIFLNRFGSWFLRRRDGTIDMLDVLDGSVDQVAADSDEFAALVNDVEWQEDFLVSLAVFKLHEAGLIATGSQCYAIPHPAIGGPYPTSDEPPNPRFTTLVDLKVWQSICRQSLGGPP